MFEKKFKKKYSQTLCIKNERLRSNEENKQKKKTKWKYNIENKSKIICKNGMLFWVDNN